MRKESEHSHQGLAKVGLNYPSSEKFDALVAEIVALSTWDVAPFVVAGKDALGQEFFYKLVEGKEEEPERVAHFLRDCQLVFPVSITSLRGTGVSRVL